MTDHPDYYVVYWALNYEGVLIMAEETLGRVAIKLDATSSEGKAVFEALLDTGPGRYFRLQGALRQAAKKLTKAPSDADLFYYASENGAAFSFLKADKPGLDNAIARQDELKAEQVKNAQEALLDARREFNSVHFASPAAPQYDLILLIRELEKRLVEYAKAPRFSDPAALQTARIRLGDAAGALANAVNETQTQAAKIEKARKRLQAAKEVAASYGLLE